MLNVLVYNPVMPKGLRLCLPGLTSVDLLVRD
jgi:hypothetical protein